MIPTSHDILQAAADDARQAYEENLNREPAMRASRAGQPLMVLALEDYIIPKLPKLESQREQDRLEKRVGSRISISLGYVFEKALVKEMQEDPKFAGVELVTQHKFDYKGITGTADLIIKDPSKSVLQVVECKSLNVAREAEATEQKLYTDNWGYLTQMSLYHAAATEAYPDYKVKSGWKVYAKQTGYVFTIPLKFQEKIVEKALQRTAAYNKFAEAFKTKDIDGCLDILFDFYDPIPLRGFYYGRSCASCGFHFNPWSAAIIDNDGLLRPDSEENLSVLLQCAFEGEDSEYRKLTEERVLKTLDTRK